MRSKREEQLSLFGNNRRQVHGNVPINKHHKRKYSLSHWSYRQRLIHEVSQSKNISWKNVYQLLNAFLTHEVTVPQIATRPGRRFATTVNQSNLHKAVHAMYLHKHGHLKLSINKITKKYKISKPTLYRAYKTKYDKNSR